MLGLGLVHKLSIISQTTYWSWSYSSVLVNHAACPHLHHAGSRALRLDVSHSLCLRNLPWPWALQITALVAFLRSVPPGTSSCLAGTSLSVPICSCIQPLALSTILPVYGWHRPRKLHKDASPRLNFGSSSSSITVFYSLLTAIRSSLFYSLQHSFNLYQLYCSIFGFVPSNTLSTLFFTINQPIAKMVSTTVNFSGLLCLFLALGPAAVLSAPAPQIPGLPVPDIMNHGPETTNQGPGNSESSAGSGVNVGIPGGPFVHAGAGVHSSHRGPCGPLSGDDQSAGAGVDVGIPGGPSVNVGTGKHDHHDGYPCPEPPVVIIPTTTASVPTYAPVIIPTTTASVPTYAPVVIPTTAPAPVVVPTYTTPIYVPHTTPAVYAPAVPIVTPSSPLIPQAAPAPSASPSPSPMPVFNAGSSLAPASVLAVAVPVILAFFH
jgi:hypothetical protein